MLKFLKDRYYGEHLSTENKAFNFIHFILIIGLSVSSLLVYFYIPGRTAYYTSIGVTVLAMLTLIEANYRRSFLIPPIIFSIIFNFFFLTMVYLDYGRMVCMIPVYMIIGLLYPVLVINGRLGLLISTIQTIYYIILISFYSDELINPLSEDSPSIIDYSGVFLAIVVSGIVGGLAIRYCIILQRKEKENSDILHEKVLEDNNSKDVFLINMSHEIRTPMNAIIGTINLLLDQNVNDRVRDSVYNVLNSCNALLSMTNELMDISSPNQDENDREVKFDFSDVIMEIVNMMSVRLMDSELRLFVDISKGIPRYLFGDPHKLKQQLIILINNAVKNTRKGDLNFILECERPLDSSGDVLIKAQVKYLDEDFNTSIPIKVSGKELIYDNYKLREINALVFDENVRELDFIRKQLSTLIIEADYVSSDESFEEYLKVGNYTHIFITYDCYINNIQFIDKYVINEKLIVMSDIIQNITLNKYGCILIKPIHLINICAALSNESNNYVHDIIKKGGFVCPNATILVVDDNLTNLNVAASLLKKYEATVITALSGKECLNILENQHVDMIFLDYMMPEMNGIDTFNRIKEMDIEYLNNVPIIALTANVVNGAKEMFIEAGFNDYLSKPIDIDAFESCLKRQLPKDMLVIKNR